MISVYHCYIDNSYIILDTMNVAQKDLLGFEFLSQNNANTRTD